jgi:integrase
LCGTQRIPSGRCRYIRFLILTGCRRGEGAGLTRDMVDRAERTISLPATFTKQARGHIVYLAPATEAVLDACALDARSELVFPSPRTGGRMSGWTRLVASVVKASGVDFTLHDLRRTFRTGLSRLGVDRDIAELALGHARGDLESVYNLDTCTDQLRAAFETWARHVAALPEPTTPADGTTRTARRRAVAVAALHHSR